MKLSGARQRSLDARADVLRADVALEFRLPHELFRLFARTTQEQRSTGRVNLIRKVANRAKTCRIDGRHIPQT